LLDELNELILADLRVLTLQQHGREKSLLTLKKHILPKIFAALFPLYVKVVSLFCFHYFGGLSSLLMSPLNRMPSKM